MPGMKVNVNNLRKQAAYSLDKLTKELNAGLLKNGDGTAFYENVLKRDSHGVEKWRRGNVLVDSDDIQTHMDDLRSFILTICAVYDAGNEDLQDVSGEVDEHGGVAQFNDEEEE